VTASAVEQMQNPLHQFNHFKPSVIYTLYVPKL